MIAAMLMLLMMMKMIAAMFNNAAEDDDEQSSKSVALSDLTLIWYAELADLAWITSLFVITVMMIVITMFNF